MSKVEYKITSADDLRSRWPAMKDTILSALRGGTVLVALGRVKRGAEMNAKFHAMISDIHHQCFRGHTVRGVKAVLINQFAIEMEESGTPLNHGGETAWDWVHQQPVYIRPSSTDFTKAEASAFIEWLYATGSEIGVIWSEPAIKAYEMFKEAQK